MHFLGHPDEKVKLIAFIVLTLTEHMLIGDLIPHQFFRERVRSHCNMTGPARSTLKVLYSSFRERNQTGPPLPDRQG